MKKLYTLMLCLALLVLVACGDNLFGSSSGNSDCGNDIKCLRLDAENAFRKGDDKRAYNICSKILSIDSSVSFGYFGMAKSSLWGNGINPLSMFSVIKPKEDEFGVPQCPFMGADTKTQDNYLQAMKEIVPVLSALDRRDTLTALYERYKRGEKDSTITAFKDIFCGGNAQSCRDTTAKKEQFPLSDREYKSSYFGGILLLSSFTKWFLGFFDTNNDGNLTGSPGDLPIAARCPIDSITGEMSVVIDTKQILDDLQDGLQKYYNCLETCTKNCDCEMSGVTDEIDNLNKTIDNFTGDDNFKELEDILSNFVTNDPDNPDQASIKDEINKYKAYAAFYKVGTHIDEDGDGCIDEDLLDGQDNDGDGLPNANARLASADPENKYYGYNEINNSMFGSNPNGYDSKYNKPVRLPPPVRIYNDAKKTAYTDLWGDESGLVTVIGFTQESGYWTSNDMALKLAVAQDTVCGELRYDLDDRKKLIGGCWPNYDDDKFIKYWLKRGLASKSDQDKRVHPKCKTCTGSACLKKK